MKDYKYTHPDFTQKLFADAPNIVTEPAPADGVAPQQFHAMSIYPEYFKVDGKWLLAEESRMDCVPVLTDNRIEVVEFRNLRRNDQVVIGRTENCEDGIYVYPHGFTGGEAEVKDAFAFRTSRTRETAFSVDYDELYDILRHDRDNGKIVWVMGPAFSFDHDARKAFAGIINEGYVHALLAGNALATHDLEGAYLDTALGQNIYTQESVHNGHYNHLETINRVRYRGSIRDFLKKENLTDGIMYACEANNVPYVLGGSIRDDGPLPEVYGDVYQAQDRMRAEVRGATTVICMATMLHSIAVGNMTPSYRVMKDGTIRPVFFYCVDISEFTINKLADRGSLSAKGIVTNVQDFIVNLSKALGAWDPDETTPVKQLR
jgi:lysine-ketoglutarate reductase/saccharopine dehydrogenase-like protein (TIGR00300 family)